MKSKLEIQDFEDKKSEAGKRYTRFKTDQGWMSCWDKGVAEKLKDAEGNFVFVEIKEQGDFKNIRKILPAEDMSDEPEAEQEASRPRPVSDYRMQQELSKQAGVATRYAVDLCVAGKIEMNHIKGNALMLWEFMKNLSEGKVKLMDEEK